MNFFLAENQLELIDQNLFTAVEAVTLIPTYGPKVILKFYAENTWIEHRLPNIKISEPENMPSDIGFLRRILETPFFGKWGDLGKHALAENHCVLVVSEVQTGSLSEGSI